MNIHCVLGIRDKHRIQKLQEAYPKGWQIISTHSTTLHSYGASRWKLQLAENTSRVNHQHNRKIQTTLSPPPDTGELVNQVTLISSTLVAEGSDSINLGRAWPASDKHQWEAWFENVTKISFHISLPYLSGKDGWDFIKSNKSYSTEFYSQHHYWL